MGNNPMVAVAVAVEEAMNK
nr:hypothetical protein [Clostridium felsineum]